MKNIGVYFLVALMSLPAFTGMTTYLSWKVNQAYIAKYLCVNKEKPQIKCKGKCQLMKNLKESSEQNDYLPIPHKIKEIQLQPFIATELVKLYLESKSDYAQLANIAYHKNFKSYHFLQKQFDPPDFSVQI